MRKDQVKKQTLENMSEISEAMKSMEVGSEELLRASETQKNLSSTLPNYKWDLSPEAIASLTATATMFYLSMIYSETRIFDTKLAETIKRVFLRIK